MSKFEVTLFFDSSTAKHRADGTGAFGRMPQVGSAFEVCGLAFTTTAIEPTRKRVEAKKQGAAVADEFVDLLSKNGWTVTGADSKQVNSPFVFEEPSSAKQQTPRKKGTLLDKTLNGIVKAFEAIPIAVEESPPQPVETEAQKALRQARMQEAEDASERSTREGFNMLFWCFAWLTSIGAAIGYSLSETTAQQIIASILLSGSVLVMCACMMVSTLIRIEQRLSKRDSIKSDEKNS